MDLLYTDRWLAPMIFKEDSGVAVDDFEEKLVSKEDTALNPYFEENGFSTRILIKNLGSTFVYLIIYAFGLSLLPLLSWLSKYSNRIFKFHGWLKNQLIWNGVLLFIMSQFPPIIIACGVNLYGMDFNSTKSKMFSSAISIILLCVCIITLPVIWKLIRKGISDLKHGIDFEAKYGSLISD
jgi:hypothetical protein